MANALGFTFLDLDKQIEKHEGLTISEIFHKKNEKYFRELEAEMLKQTAPLKDTVIACGGGTPCFYDNLDFMLANGKVVYLKLLENSLFKRLSKAKEARPLLEKMDEDELKLFINEELTSRSKYYCRANFIIQAEQYTPSMLKEDLISASE